MPIYEYKCESCGAERELFVRTADAAPPRCAACRKRMRRVISPTSFILKGSGWYVTDYPSEARKKGLEGEKRPAVPTSGAKESAAGAKKPEAPTPSPTPATGEKKAAKAAKKRG